MICKECGQEVPTGMAHYCGKCADCPLHESYRALAKAWAEQRDYLGTLEEIAKGLRDTIRDAATNCPSCGRHDFGLLSGEIRELRELRKKIEGWAQEVSQMGYCPALIEEMMAEARK